MLVDSRRMCFAAESCRSPIYFVDVHLSSTPLKQEVNNLLRVSTAGSKLPSAWAA